MGRGIGSILLEGFEYNLRASKCSSRALGLKQRVAVAAGRQARQGAWREVKAETEAGRRYPRVI